MDKNNTMNKVRSSCVKHSCKANVKEELLMKYIDAYEGKCQLAAVRKKMAIYAIHNGNLAAAEHFECHINTVSKWKIRYIKNEPLTDRPKIPINIPHRIINHELTKRVLELREEEGYGSLMLQKQFNLPASNMTIHKILKDHGLVQPRKKKWREKNELWHIKKKYKTLETKLQMDGKNLMDIPRYVKNQLKHNLPKELFSIRCVKSGITFSSFMNKENCSSAKTFIVYVFEHLKKHGVDVSKLTIQIDAASYAINMNSPKISSFRDLVENVYGAKLKIVPGGKTKQSDIERFNGLIENELFRRFDFDSIQDLYSKTYKYLFKFNFVRVNRNKDWAPPIYYLNQDQPHVSSDVMLLPPLDLDKHTDMYHYKLNPRQITLNEIISLELFLEENNYIEEFQYNQLVATLPNNHRHIIKNHTHDVPISVNE